jgi:hypothetical protein
MATPVDEQVKRAGMQAAEVAATQIKADEAAAKAAGTLKDKLGLVEALIDDPTYGPELKRIFDLWKSGQTVKAAEEFTKTKFGQLDTDAQENYILSLSKKEVYKERLKSWKIGIKKQLAALDVVVDDAKLDDYYLRGIDAETIIDEAIGGISRKGGAEPLGGLPGNALDTLRSTARANGFNLEKDFGNQVDGWLQRVARGEDVDKFNRIIRQQAKLGLPEKVGSLLDEGLDLANIYAPYRNTMASLLEVTPDSINLDDSLLRGAYGPDKEMSIYDFKRMVRKDPRWQYTDNAREEVASATLGILRDFGFQG